MRNYASVRPEFWTRGTGKRLRGNPLAQVLACYLMTSPHTSMTGIFSIALPTVAHEIGASVEEVRAALVVLESEDFAHYDEDEEIMYLPSGARTQIGETLSEKDSAKRSNISKALALLGDHRFVRDFLERYSEQYRLAPNWPPTGPQEASKRPTVVSEEVAVGGLCAHARVPAPAPVPDPVRSPEGDPGEERPPTQVDLAGRPLPRKPLLPEMVQRDAYQPSQRMLDYGRGMGLADTDLDGVLCDLRDKHGLRPHTLDWWDERWLRFAERAKESLRVATSPSTKRIDGLDDVEVYG